MILVWPIGVPAVFAFLLWTHRHALSPSSSYSSFPRSNPLLASSSDLAIKSNSSSSSNNNNNNTTSSSLVHDKSLDWFKILFEGYRPLYFFWEIVATARRLFLIAVLVVVSQGNDAGQLVVGLFACLVFMTLHARYFPFEEKFENSFALGCEWVVYLALFCALLGKLDPSNFEGSKGKVVGLSLAACTLGVLLLSVVFVQFEVGKAVVVTVTLKVASAHHAS
jgi:hypothetical protein